MTRFLNGIAGGLGLAAVLLCVLPIAESVGASPPARTAGQVNRAIKTDRLILPQSVATKKPSSPVRTLQEGPTPVSDRGGKPKPPELKDGCEPLFSPVTTPALAHLSGRCIG
jgi:hypothetical protein